VFSIHIIFFYPPESIQAKHLIIKGDGSLGYNISIIYISERFIQQINNNYLSLPLFPSNIYSAKGIQHEILTQQLLNPYCFSHL
jgi:hypothetical protein